METGKTLAMKSSPSNSAAFGRLIIGAGCIAFASLAGAQITAEVEPNDSVGAATGPVTAGVFVSGSINGAGDVDFFSYTVPGTGKLSVGVHGGPGATFSWVLRNSLGGLVAESNTGGRPELATITVPAGSAGDVHTIEVRRETVLGPASQVSPYYLGIAYVDGSSRPTKPGYITNNFTGTSGDSPNEPLGGPAMMLMGGGTEVDNQFKDLVWPILNRGNIVVVRNSSGSGYQSYFNTTIPNLIGPGNTPASVETIVIDSVSKANENYTSWVLSRAELVWFAGGDQSVYLNNFKGTTLQRAVQQAYMRGAVVGGTSAGAMILGQYCYDPDGVTAVTSAQAVANPYHPSIHLGSEAFGRFETEFFRFPIMKDILVETHTLFHNSNPNRLGRDAAFMAYLRARGLTGRLFVLAMDDSGGFFIPSKRIGTARWTRYEVWVLRDDATTNYERVVAGQTLIARDILFWRAEQDRSDTLTQTYNFDTGGPVAGGFQYRGTIDDMTYSPTDWYLTNLPVSLSGFGVEQ
jgi:hypothetical protein